MTKAEEQVGRCRSLPRLLLVLLLGLLAGLVLIAPASAAGSRGVSHSLTATTAATSYDTAVPAGVDSSFRYLYGPGGVPVEQIPDTSGRGCATATAATGGSCWFTVDAVGSPRLVTAVSGLLAGSVSYSDYGTRTTTSGVAPGSGFTGALTDPGTGWVYLHARDYDPTTGVFVEPDPALAVTGQLYTYVGNTPTTFTDPTGLCSWVNPVCELDTAAHGLADAAATVAHGALVLEYNAANALTGGLVGRLDETLSPGSTCGLDNGPLTAAGQVLGIVGAQFIPVLDIEDDTTTALTLEQDTTTAANTATTDGRSVDEVLNSLPEGKQGFVRTVPDEQTLQSTFDELTQGGTPTTWKGYGGQVFELPDGTQIGLRGTASSGGATIDIRIPGQSVPQKIHIG